jgi:hypothetical protein
MSRLLGLNEEQYLAVCEACDRVLLAPDSTIERVAIPWLHVIREHPVVLANYVDLFELAKGCMALVGKWWRFIHSTAVWYRQIGRSLRSDGQPWYGSEELPRGIDVLFVSHLLNPSQAGKADDFYFGGLANEMVTSGHSTVIALIDHSGQPAASLASKWQGSTVPRVILSKSLSFWEEVALHRRLKKESLRLRKLAKKEGSGLSRYVLARASEEGLANGSLANLRRATQISALVAKLQPKAIVVIHEGHAWERVVFAAARSVRPRVRCIGYQHAAIFRLQHAIRRNLACEYNPDQILTAGTVGKAQLESTPGLNGIPISVLGSNRTFKGAVNGESPMRRGQAEQSNNSMCLVLPEGIASECHLLFEFSLDCVQAYPEIKFIWRLHTFVTHESLATKNPRLRKLPPNIVLSQATLEEDIARCRYALYRGTTAIVQAAVAGLRPIYLQLPDEMTIDPLYELKVWRINVKTIEDFHFVIRHDQDRLLKDSESEFRLAEGYCSDLFKSLNPSALESAIIEKRNSETL